MVKHHIEVIEEMETSVYFTTHIFPEILQLRAIRQSQLFWRKVTQTGCDLHADKEKRKHVAIGLIIYGN